MYYKAHLPPPNMCCIEGNKLFSRSCPPHENATQLLIRFQFYF